MAVFTMTIPDADMPRVTVALCRTAQLAVSGANAEQAVINYIQQSVQNIAAADAAAAVQAQSPPPAVTLTLFVPPPAPPMV